MRKRIKLAEQELDLESLLSYSAHLFGLQGWRISRDEDFPHIHYVVKHSGEPLGLSAWRVGEREVYLTSTYASVRGKPTWSLARRLHELHERLYSLVELLKSRGLQAVRRRDHIEVQLPLHALHLDLLLYFNEVGELVGADIEQSQPLNSKEEV